MESTIESVSAGPRRAAAFQIDVRSCCAPLPKQVREKWKEWETARAPNRHAALENISSRLERAEKRREAFRQWLTRKPKRTAQVRRRIAEQSAVKAKRLEEKLAGAENKRRLRLEHVRSKATAMLQRSELAAERVNERQELMAQKLYDTLNAAEMRRLALIEAERERLSAAHELVTSKLAQVQVKEEQEREETKKQLGAKLVQAECTRSAILTAASEKAGNKVRHAKHVSKMRRLNEERDTELKRSCLLVKLQTAADRRYEACTVRVAINAEKSETQFLKRQATKREKLRRSGSSRLLQNRWLSFRDSNKTTKELASRVLKSGVTFLTIDHDERSDDDMTTKELIDPFEEFASRLKSTETINATEAFLSRMKMKLLGKSKGAHDCSNLMKRLYPRVAKNKLERYPTRVFLCAYMVLNHPEVVFNHRGEREAALSSASKQMIESFERLVQFYLLPVCDLSDRSDPSVSELFNAFDNCWVAYLEQFVAWKLHDAAGLAESLIKMAYKMQLSMLRKVAGDIHSDRVRNNSDLMIIVQQVQHDHTLLRERVQRLEGRSGLKKFDAALEAAREKYEAESSGESGENNSVTESDASTTNRRVSESEDTAGSRSEGGSGNGGRPPRRSPLTRHDDGLSVNLKKEVFIWELLYDRNFQIKSNVIEMVWDSAVAAEPPTIPKMSTIEASPASVQKQFTAVAEKAFWDSVEEKLTSDPGGAAVHVCTMLMEIGTDLSSLLPNTHSAKIVEQYLKDEEELMKLLQETESDADTLNTGRLLSLLEHTSELLRECGSEARNAAAVDAQKRLKESILSALEQEDRSILVKAICRTLRLLYAQLKVLSFDLANARIRALSSALTGAAAIKYSQEKFATVFGLTGGDLRSNLPKTKQWIERIAELRHSLELLLEPLSADLVHPRRNIPSSMRSGRMASSSESPLEQWPEVHYSSPVRPSSWQTAFRIGLIDLVSQPLPLTSQNVPETMRLDVQRLHNLQNAFQRLVVMSASLLTLQQVKGQAVPQETLLTMKPRLATILQHPNVNLSTLTSELVSMADIEGDVEQHINNTLISLINREKSGFKALNNGLIKAMSICLVAGESTEAPAIKKAIQAMLSKIGSVYLIEDVKEVASELSMLVGINEAVHAKTYESMF